MKTFATERIPQAKPRTYMTNGRFLAALMKAPLLDDIGFAHSLPPGEAVPIYPVDMLPGCPESWVRGPGSYVCPVEPNWGLWFDWTANDALNTAVIASVRGMNPITGQKLEGLQLESYTKKCPMHKIPFKGDHNFCPECGYKWPPQNYVCHPNTLWWDGFRKADGKVRQFFFTQDEARDIPSLVIGKENVVPAFGFVFYEPKKRREETIKKSRVYGSSVQGYGTILKGLTEVKYGGGGWQSSGDTHQNYGGDTLSYKYTPGMITNNCSTKGPQGLTGLSGSTGEGEQKTSGGVVIPTSCSFDGGLIPDQILYAAPAAGAAAAEDSLAVEISAGPRTKGARIVRASTSEEVAEAKAKALKDKEVSVGAGAEILQNLDRDPLGSKRWKSKPAAMMRLYFVFEPQFDEIAKKGCVDLDGSSDGFLKGLPVGNK